ncbi:uncharacterized protein LOC134239169 [Saccostrea cucullata]|uniref:uncharacterized protein LOC134239169 n=1 Tax=Saccostrea cuccullata TaxID=36930 RepID=UPI002ED0F342
MHEPDEIKIDNTASYTLLQKEADSPKNQANDQHKEKEQVQQKSNPSTMPKLPEVPETVKQKETIIQKTDESMVLQTEHGRKGLKIVKEQIQGEIKKKLLEKFEMTR